MTGGMGYVVLVLATWIITGLTIWWVIKDVDSKIAKGKFKSEKQKENDEG